MLLSCPWSLAPSSRPTLTLSRPNYELSYQFRFSSGASNATLADLLAAMISSAQWIFQTEISFQQNDTQTEKSQLQLSSYLSQLQANMIIVIEGCNAYTSLWNDLLPTQDHLNNDHHREYSLFDRRPLPSPETTPTLILFDFETDLISVTKILDLILKQIHCLGRYYRQLSQHYCELMMRDDLKIILSCVGADSNGHGGERMEEYKRIIIELMERIESLTKTFVLGWKEMILMLGCSLIRPPPVQQNPTR
jgi:hypothetical protein